MQGYDFYKKMSVFLVQVQTIPQFIILIVCDVIRFMKQQNTECLIKMLLGATSVEE